MKRAAIYVTIIAAALFLTQEDREIGQLVPAEVLMVVQKEDTVTLKTDTGEEGKGKNFAEAKADLETKTSGILFLDTVKYLVMTSEDDDLLEQVRQFLKSSVKLVYMDAGANPAELARYLDAHWQDGMLKMQNVGVRQNSG